jgi:hypothetical protein
MHAHELKQGKGLKNKNALMMQGRSQLESKHISWMTCVDENHEQDLINLAPS